MIWKNELVLSSTLEEILGSHDPRSTVSIKSGFHAVAKGERRRAKMAAAGGGQIVG